MNMIKMTWFSAYAFSFTVWMRSALGSAII